MGIFGFGEKPYSKDEFDVQTAIAKEKSIEAKDIASGIYGADKKMNKIVSKEYSEVSDAASKKAAELYDQAHTEASKIDTERDRKKKAIRDALLGR